MTAASNQSVFISADQLNSCLTTARVSGVRVYDELSTATGLPPEKLATAIAQTCQLQLMTLEDMTPFLPAFDVLSLAESLTKRVALLRRDSELRIVLCDPFDTALRIWIESIVNAPLMMAVATPADIQGYLSIHEATARAVESALEFSRIDNQQETNAEEISYATATQDASHAVKLVNSTIYDALKAGVSDIHLEADEYGLVVRYRIDGMLDKVADIKGRELGEQIISRIKVLAELDIAERRIPQDGSFRVRSGKREIDLRVSVMPSVHGEDSVIRILDKQRMVEETGSLTMDSLGFEQETLSRARNLLEQPYGMLLVTGPTGSGKTTTLYAALSEINHGHDKIITIEDPVEYQIKGILQIPVNDKKGLTFARGLRSILRHDPDKIMVGEIRDRETAEIAIQAALTGHLVLTTVHANNIIDVFSRFTHMNIDPYAFSSALNGVWAQRLVRLICPHCSVSRPATDAEVITLNMQHVQRELLVAHGKGCGNCRGSGYRGRRAIAELLRLDDEFREMIVDRQPSKALREAAKVRGVKTLRDLCIDMVLRAETTVDELKRVTVHA